MMTPRYYFPRIEEFHDGLDYVVIPDAENEYSDNSTYSYATYSMGDDIKHLLEARVVKVRHLDMDDFILLGFEAAYPIDSDDPVSEWTYNNIGYNKVFTFKFHSGRGHLKIQYGTITLYAGSCPNVNEFKRLLSRLGIELPNEKQTNEEVIRASEDNK